MCLDSPQVSVVLRTKTSNPVCFADAAKLVSYNHFIYFKTTNGQFLLFQALGISRVILQAPGLTVSETFMGMLLRL